MFVQKREQYFLADMIARHLSVPPVPTGFPELVLEAYGTICDCVIPEHPRQGFTLEELEGVEP